MDGSRGWARVPPADAVVATAAPDVGSGDLAAVAPPVAGPFTPPLHLDATAAADDSTAVGDAAALIAATTPSIPVAPASSLPLDDDGDGDAEVFLPAAEAKALFTATAILADAPELDALSRWLAVLRASRGATLSPTDVDLRNGVALAEALGVIAPDLLPPAAVRREPTAPSSVGDANSGLVRVRSVERGAGAPMATAMAVGGRRDHPRAARPPELRGGHVERHRRARPQRHPHPPDRKSVV